MALSPATYSRTQRALHWLVVAGVAFQIGFHEFIVTVTEQVANGGAPEGLAFDMSIAHVATGLAIGLATIVRLVLRFTRGVPVHAREASMLQGSLASIVHWAFYVLLLAMVTTGILTFARIAPLGQIHELVNFVLVVTIVAHVAAALFGQFVRRDGTISRMLGGVRED